MYQKNDLRHLNNFCGSFILFSGAALDRCVCVDCVEHRNVYRSEFVVVV